jgi:hypothetical protein
METLIPDDPEVAEQIALAREIMDHDRDFFVGWPSDEWRATPQRLDIP